MLDKRVLPVVCGGRVLSFRSKTYIMGILNVTPDSFSDGGRYRQLDAALRHAEEMIEAGADIIDVGGESTRPFAEPVSTDEELSRVGPVISAIRKRWDILLSIDTYKAVVAREAVSLGADIINDITALRHDPEMIGVLSAFPVLAILMHMQGMPQDMQLSPHYGDVVAEVTAFLKGRLEWASEQGVDRDRFIIDPGIGFGKTLNHNLELLRSISSLKQLGRPILVGPSRKSFLSKILRLRDGQEDEATQAALAISIWQGATIVRVHDVRSAVCTARIVEAIREGQLPIE